MKERQASYQAEPSYRKIMVGGAMIGMTGVDELLAELYKEGRVPDRSLKEELLEKARENNYFSTAAETDYAEALLREYEKFYQRRTDGKKEAVRTSSHRTWRGIPREQVPWYPSLYEDMCDGCGECLAFCPNHVFDQGEGNRVLIVEPFNCLVGCDACVKVCPRGAISFRPRSVLENLGR